MNYFLRAIKYLLSLCILYVGVVYLASFAGMFVLTPQETFESLIHTQRGIIMIIAILALSFSYPVFGFMKQEVSGDIKTNRDAIIRALSDNGFSLASEGEGEMTFECNNFMKKVAFLFEDKITITQVGDKLVVEGIRRAVAYIIYRLEGYISFSDDNKE